MMTPDKFQELLARARANAQKAGENTNGYSKLSETISIERPTTIDISAFNLGPQPRPEILLETIQEVVSGNIQQDTSNGQDNDKPNIQSDTTKLSGVEREIILNS